MLRSLCCVHWEPMWGPKAGTSSTGSTGGSGLHAVRSEHVRARSLESLGGTWQGSRTDPRLAEPALAAAWLRNTACCICFFSLSSALSKPPRRERREHRPAASAGSSAQQSCYCGATHEPRPGSRPLPIRFRVSESAPVCGSALGCVQCSAVQCSAVQCSAVQCSAVQCSAAVQSATQAKIHLNKAACFLMRVHADSASNCVTYWECGRFLGVRSRART